MKPDDLQKAVAEKLATVIDPETGADVIHMRLVLNLTVDEVGIITYAFRPSSPLCPIAVPLVLAVIDAAGQVPGVTGQRVTVVDYVPADMLNDILKTILKS